MAPRGGVYVAPELKVASTRTVDVALGEPFPSPFEVSVGEGPNTVHKVVNNCVEYLAIRDGEYSTSGSLEDRRLRYLGGRCDALDWLRGAKQAAHPAFAHFSWRRVTVRQLPPELALNISRESEEKAKAVSARGGSILEMEPDLRLRVKSANDAELVSEDETITLAVYAHGDFLGDGNEELLVRWQSAVKGGTYTSTYVFLLGRGKNGLVVLKRRPSD